VRKICDNNGALQFSRVLNFTLKHFAALGLLTTMSVPAQTTKGSDETGTLVMAGRTSSGVVISIDSAIDESGRVLIDGSRKLIDVGTRSACSIDGFSGHAATGNNLGRDLRDWVHAHPRTNATEALISLLKLAVNSWDKEHYPPYAMPQGRKPGDIITTIVCGDEFSDGPGILVGATKVALDSTAVVGEMARTPTPMYVGGVFPTTDIFLGLVQRGNIPEGVHSQFIKTYKAAYKDLNADKSAMGALQEILVVESAMRDESEKSFIKPYYPPSILAQANLKVLFTAVYKTIEANTREVARPNQVRLITNCGRFATTVEANWKTCNN